MKIIVGLGNPGELYKNTRHNVGFMVVEELAGGKSWSKSKSGLLEYAWLSKPIKTELIKPLTFMNRSGEAVGYVIKKHSENSYEDLYVVHDDLDIRFGEYKIQFGKGPKVHNGVASVEKVLGTDQFWRVRMGVDNREGDRTLPGRAYVLQRFTQEEMGVIGGVIDETARRLLE